MTTNPLAELVAARVRDDLSAGIDAEILADALLDNAVALEVAACGREATVALLRGLADGLEANARG